MGDDTNKKLYLDFNGLKKYDEQIKSYIAFGNESFSADISDLQIDVSALKAIDHDAYISADTNLEISLKGYVDDKLELKQGVITDLEDIRSGAALGATAIQNIPDEFITESELADKKYATESQVENLIDSVVIMASDGDIDDIFK
jgi:hypothetical protein